MDQAVVTSTVKRSALCWEDRRCSVFYQHGQSGKITYRVFETVRFEAKRYGVGILGSEVIGLGLQPRL